MLQVVVCSHGLTIDAYEMRQHDAHIALGIMGHGRKNNKLRPKPTVSKTLDVRSICMCIGGVMGHGCKKSAKWGKHLARYPLPPFIMPSLQIVCPLHVMDAGWLDTRTAQLCLRHGALLCHVLSCCVVQISYNPAQAFAVDSFG